MDGLSKFTGVFHLWVLLEGLYQLYVRLRLMRWMKSRSSVEESTNEKRNCAVRTWDRMIRRVIGQAISPEEKAEAVHAFIKGMFDKVTVNHETPDLLDLSPLLCTKDSSDTTQSTLIQVGNKSDQVVFEAQDITVAQVEQYFAWYFFDKDTQDLFKNDQCIIEECFRVTRHVGCLDFVRVDDKQPTLRPRRHSFDDWGSVFVRPLFVTIAIWILFALMYLILYVSGYTRVTSSNGITGWFRNGDPSKSPVVFCHGVSPIGLLAYLPLILEGLLKGDDRPSLLIETNSVTWTRVWTVQAFSKEECREGVSELLHECLGDFQPITLCGHSLGSIQAAWLVDALPVQHLMLMDPVALRFGDGHTLKSFLYSKLSLYRRLFRSELFTIAYLRRQRDLPANELWLEDLKNVDRVSVFLSERDAFLDCNAISSYVDTFAFSKSVVWKRTSHGMLLVSTSLWSSLRSTLAPPTCDTIDV